MQVEKKKIYSSLSHGFQAESSNVSWGGGGSLYNAHQKKSRHGGGGLGLSKERKGDNQAASPQEAGETSSLSHQFRASSSPGGLWGNSTGQVAAPGDTL